MRRSSCCEGCTGRSNLYYAHVEKTGGSSLECAMKPFIATGRMISMGHSVEGPEGLARCRTQCGKAPLAISVRDPYSCHEALFKYAFAGQLSPTTWQLMISPMHNPSRP